MAYEGGINYGNFSRHYSDYYDEIYSKWHTTTASDSLIVNFDPLTHSYNIADKNGRTFSFPEEVVSNLCNNHDDSLDVYRYAMDFLNDEFTKLILYGEEEMTEAERFKKTFEPKHVLVNGDYTTVVWMDGDKTVVKRNPDEPYDFDKAIMYAMLKKIFDGNGSDMRRFLKKFEEKTTKKKK